MAQQKKHSDPADEIAQALRVMQTVLVKQDSHLRKRELKHKTKKNQAPDSGSLVDQLFQPLPQTFKGLTPIVALDCEMV